MASHPHSSRSSSRTSLEIRDRAPRSSRSSSHASQTSPAIRNSLQKAAQHAAEKNAIPCDTMLPTLKRLDKKYDDNGTHYYVETTPPPEIPAQLNWWDKFALCLVREIDSLGYVSSVKLRVNSPVIKQALKEAIGSFPGLSFATREIAIPSPYRVLFHYRRELGEVAGRAEEGSVKAKHLASLVQFIEDEFRETSEESANLLNEGMVSYELAWMLFRPGTVVYAATLGQERAFRVSSYDYGRVGLVVHAMYVDFDGEGFGKRDRTLVVGEFGGALKVVDLEVFPVEWHAEPERLKRRLRERGKRFEAFAGMHFQAYKGIAVEMLPNGGITSKYSVDGRVVVDAATFHRLNPNLAFSVSAFKSSKPEEQTRRRPAGRSTNYGDIANFDEYGVQDAMEEQEATAELFPETQISPREPLTDDERLLAAATVRGFSFTEKRWLDFFVENLSPINWDPHCFDRLVLPPTQKELVRALVATHVDLHPAFTDIVKGKGRGLVLLLHGPPGVGKTLTAETVAEFCKRPLYSVSSGDLGIDSETLDERLSRILDMASTWKAVLLIDEADVFLEQRSLHNLQRNSLVSIFLRVLEYYQGILFLTTNRVRTFDAAFKSRISVPLKYGDLTAESRLRIWKDFLGGVESADGFSEAELAGLAGFELNGRQIKNVVKTAQSLARFHGKEMDAKILQQVVGIQVEFEEELGDAVGGTEEP